MDLLAIKPCTADAFEVIPKEELRLDLGQCERMLKGKGYEIVSNPGVMLVVRRGIEMTLYPHGRVLLHPVESKELAETLAQELFTALEL